MKSKIKYLLVATVFIALIVCWYAYSEYNRKPADLSSVDASVTTDAHSLVAMYEKDEQKANGLYLGKAVDVTGSIAEVNNQLDTMVNFILSATDEMHRVSCLMNVNRIDDLKQYRAGDKITVRGICTGYLMDVELNRCVVVKK